MGLSRRSFFAAVAASPLSAVTPAKAEPVTPTKVVVTVDAGTFDETWLREQVRREAELAVMRSERAARERGGDWRS